MLKGCVEVVEPRSLDMRFRCSEITSSDERELKAVPIPITATKEKCLFEDALRG